jgi:hypothetical protein
VIAGDVRVGDIRVVICRMGCLALGAAEILLNKKSIKIVCVVVKKHM